MKRQYTYSPDLPDKRDHYFMAPPGDLPNVVDLRHDMSRVEDQGATGSCTAQAAVALVEHLDFKTDRRYRNYSRLFLYYNERVIEGTVEEDSGAYIRDAVKALARWGICYEADWPYVEDRFADKPDPAAYTRAIRRRALDYQRVDQTEQSVCSALLLQHPVIIGFSVYESFESDAVAVSGHMPMPKPHEQLLGGHAVAIVGYDLVKRLFLCRNSWGILWGERGYFYMPFEYALDGDLAEDFWIIREVANVR